MCAKFHRQSMTRANRSRKHGSTQKGTEEICIGSGHLGAGEEAQRGTALLALEADKGRTLGNKTGPVHTCIFTSSMVLR